MARFKLIVHADPNDLDFVSEQIEVEARDAWDALDTREAVEMLESWDPVWGVEAVRVV